jgi:carbon monoxide dehydrogenase subunit G
MIAVSATVSIARPPELVFNVLSDVERYLASWADGPVAATKATPGPTQIGSVFVITAKAGPMRIRYRYEILGWEPPTRLVGRGVVGPVRFEVEYRLLDAAGSTDLEQSIRANLSGPFRLAKRVVQNRLRRQVALELRRLRTLVETLHPPRGGPPRAAPL